MEKYVFRDGKRLRCGYTTGSCAAAASRAAAEMLLTGKKVKSVRLKVPQGLELDLEILWPEIGEGYAACSVRKDAGDDPDVTDGILVSARAEKTPLGIVIRGGRGVGTVTKPGLDQPVGAAAINTVPRRMITEAVAEVCEAAAYEGGISITISVPDGEELAKKTYNPRLGIEGGISIIGTTGIVEPMSSSALVETTRAEMRMRRAEGRKILLLTVGNYGRSFLARELPLAFEQSVKCGNFIGEAIDCAAEIGFDGVLLVGHIGKLVKLGAGIMNTHSSMADGRMEVLVTCGLLAGARPEALKRLPACATVDAALAELTEAEREKTAAVLMERADFHLQARAKGALKIGALMFSDKYGIIGKTAEADGLTAKITEEERGRKWLILSERAVERRIF